MTATEVLRRLLDERGGFRVDFDREGARRTCWKNDDEQDGYCYFDEDAFGATQLTVTRITAEQAIAATLWRGMLTADDVRDLIELHSDASGGNGRDFHNGAYVAIADELNATLGAGTCKADKLCDGYLYYTSYWCRGCGERFAYRPIGGKDRGASPKFCPNCGAKVVGSTTNRMLEINDLLKRQQEEMRMLLEKQNEEGEDA